MKGTWTMMTTTKREKASFHAGSVYVYQRETIVQSEKIKAGTVAAQSQALGIDRCEPLLVCMDALLRYAKAYQKSYGAKLASDGYLGAPWLRAAKGIRMLLNGNGAVAMERGITTDSKDNGVIEGLFWDALAVAGYEEADL